MKVLGLLIVFAIVVMGYCVYNSIFDPIDVVADVSSIENSGCKGPFGIDSQKILNDDPDPKYKVGVVSNIEFKQNADSTWYIWHCKLSNLSGKTVFFTPPYPQQNDLMDGDFIGFSGNSILFVFTGGEKSYHYADVIILDYISSQSVKCNIDDIRGLSTPSDDIPVRMSMPPNSTLATEKDFVSVTGVIMAIQIVKNRDPEPDNPYDYLIELAAMKCADGRLYLADFEFHKSFFRHKAVGNVNLPSNDAFGEGDVVTVTQTLSVFENDRTFAAYYKEK